ncbi:50S ribosomal protein L30 [Spirochaetia bacterium 38H-sp]|uniref:Large ribosomal subunit protein uL30 n=1 Tax=Rarispira pelagica TaxID=3141764 RepID=A0ABU9UDU8_9SPIR
MASKKAKKVKIRLVKSLIGRNERQRRTIKALGLKRLNSEVEKELTPAIEGMLKKMAYFVEVEEL